MSGSDALDDGVVCYLQYWSWLNSRFTTYSSFKLSESAFQEVDLPEVCIPLVGGDASIGGELETVVPTASTWRLMIGYK
jgi:hypothetical protein